jgi:hypothetical protein
MDLPAHDRAKVGVVPERPLDDLDRTRSAGATISMCAMQTTEEPEAGQGLAGDRLAHFQRHIRP